MEEIQVNEYVRTKKGFIAKVSEVDSGYVFSDDTIDKAYEECRGYVDEKEILKHSFNIIDLIEVGDIVDIKTGLYSGFMYFVENEDNLMLLKEQIKKFWVIKSIVTKEQFETMKYKLEE